MPLKLRPTGLGHGVYNNTVDYGVFCGEWCIGRNYETRTGPADLRWFWALYAPSKPGTLRTDSRAATLHQAKVEFEASWKQWKAWAGMDETTEPPCPSVAERSVTIIYWPDLRDPAVA